MWVHVYTLAGPSGRHKPLWAGVLAVLPRVGDLAQVAAGWAPLRVEAVAWILGTDCVEIRVTIDTFDEYPQWDGEKWPAGVDR